MKSKKKYLQIAKFICKCCLTSNRVDPSKVPTALAALTKSKLIGTHKILKIYKRLIERALSKEQVVIETAQNVPQLKQLEKKLLEKTGASRIIYKINPEIVFGAKITHGDWIYDATLDAKLKQLTISDKR